jgi:hypothetical protein
MRKLSAIFVTFALLLAVSGCGTSDRAEPAVPKNTESIEKGEEVPETQEDESELAFQEEVDTEIDEDLSSVKADDYTYEENWETDDPSYGVSPAGIGDFYEFDNGVSMLLEGAEEVVTDPTYGHYGYLFSFLVTNNGQEVFGTSIFDWMAVDGANNNMEIDWSQESMNASSKVIPGMSVRITVFVSPTEAGGPITIGYIPSGSSYIAWQVPLEQIQVVEHKSDTEKFINEYKEKSGQN